MDPDRNQTSRKQGREKASQDAGSPETIRRLVKNLHEVHRWQGVLLGELAQRTEELIDQENP